MASERQRITVIGTGCIGTSIGMALRQSPDAGRLEIVGHDREMNVARKAQKLGGFDRIEFNMDLALTGARLVILAVPLSALREVLGDLGRLMEPNGGMVVTDTAHVKAPVIRWAEELLPEGNHFVGGDLFLAPRAEAPRPAGEGEAAPRRTPGERLSGPEDAAPDLFRDAVYSIAARPDDHPSAVRAVTNLALVLGAEPYYMDPVEHDAARALVEGIPDVAATALFQALAGAPGWAEVRKAAGRPFSTATAAAAGEPASRRMLMLLNRESLLRGLDAYLERLNALRESLAQNDADALDKALAGASEARAYWSAETSHRTWEIERGLPERDSLFQRTLQTLFGEGMSGKERRREP